MIPGNIYEILHPKQHTVKKEKMYTTATMHEISNIFGMWLRLEDCLLQYGLVDMADTFSSENTAFCNVAEQLQM